MKTSDGREKTINPLTVVMVFVLLAPIGVAYVYLSSSAGAHTPTDRVFEITARQWAYEPSVIQVNQGDNVTIVLQSADVAHSGIYIEGYDIKQTLIVQPGKPAEVIINFIADKSGTFVFKCVVPCGPFHPFMTGVLKVEPNHNLQGASALAAAIAILISSTFVFRKR